MREMFRRGMTQGVMVVVLPSCDMSPFNATPTGKRRKVTSSSRISEENQPKPPCTEMV